MIPAQIDLINARSVARRRRPHAGVFARQPKRSVFVICGYPVDTLLAEGVFRRVSDDLHTCDAFLGRSPF